MSSNLVESLIGALVLIIAGWFLVYAYERTEGGLSGGYTLQASFERIDGLGIGADVRLSGIKVGSIVASELDPKTYQAIVRFSVTDEVKLPLDTAAAITSEGLLGGTYLSLRPGGSLENLAPGDEIQETQDAVDLIGLIGKFMYGDSSAKQEE